MVDLYGFNPSEVEEWDDLLVEYKNSAKIGRPAFEQLVASVEHVFPRFRRRLMWSHAVLQGWHIATAVKHAVPLGQGPAALVASTWACQGLFRLALGLLVQAKQGLRPSEMLRLKPIDITPPSLWGGAIPTGAFGHHPRGTHGHQS